MSRFSAAEIEHPLDAPAQGGPCNTLVLVWTRDYRRFGDFSALSISLTQIYITAHIYNNTHP